jgi:uncharacterized membrane protein SpoIIM required for sporulation
VPHISCHIFCGSVLVGTVLIGTVLTTVFVTVFVVEGSILSPALHGGIDGSKYAKKTEVGEPMTSVETEASGFRGPDDPLTSVKSFGSSEVVNARQAFITRRQARWDELDALCAKASGKVTRLSEDELQTLGLRYRELSADLAIARRDYPNDPLLRQLESRMTPARSLIYDQPPRAFTAWHFLSRRYWQRVFERKWLLLAAVVLLMLPGVIVYFWTLKDPARVQTLYPDNNSFRTSYDDLGFSGEEQIEFSSQIFINNIRVSLLAFAAGITFGVGTAWILISNGMLLGFVVGLAVSKGNGDVVFALISAHGVLELSIIAVTAMAGLRLGMALVRPGLTSRARALRREAVAAVEIVIGTIPWFVLAGLIEGFFTPAGFGPMWSGIVGFSVGAIYWALVFWRGRTRART